MTTKIWGNIDQVFVRWRHQTITWTNVDFSCGVDPHKQCVPKLLLSIMSSKIVPLIYCHLSQGDYELRNLIYAFEFTKDDQKFTGELYCADCAYNGENWKRCIRIFCIS